MEPRFDLKATPGWLSALSPIIPQRTIETPNQREDGPLRTPFLYTGWEADELLKWAYAQGVIDEKGRVVGNHLFDVNKNLRTEIQSVIDRLQLKGYIDPKSEDLPSFSIDFLTCVLGLQEELKAEALPEIIGGAVPYLLGEQFFIQFAVKRFHLQEDEARRLLGPALRLIRKRPADIDFRQYVTDSRLLNEGFKDSFSQVLISLLVKETNGCYLDPHFIKNHYFHKFSFVSDATKCFGMGRFGSFDGLPLEYFAVDKLERAFIANNKSIALTLQKPRRKGAPCKVGLKFYAGAQEGVYPETPLFQQMALVLDAQNVKGVDWRGFLSMMAEVTRSGYRTLDSSFMDGLLNTFIESKVDLIEKISWALENHLLNRGENEQEAHELINAFYLNLIIYLLSRDSLDEGTLQFLLKSCGRLPEPLNFLKSILLIPMRSLQCKLAWFQLGMWLRLSQGVPQGSLSMNYGEACHRFVTPVAEAVVWIPVDLERAAERGVLSLQDEEWESVAEKLLIQMEMLTQPMKEGVEKNSYPLSQLSSWFDSNATKKIAARCRLRKYSSHALRMAMKIDTARIHSGLETALPAEWLKVLPDLIAFFPEEYECNPFLHTLISGADSRLDGVVLLPKKETFFSHSDWILYLVRSPYFLHRQMGLEILRESKNLDAALIKGLEVFTWDLLKASLSIKEEMEWFPWVLFALCCGAYHKSCQLGVSKEGQLFLHAGNQRIPIFRSDLIAVGLKHYRLAEDKTAASRLLQIDLLASKPALLSVEERNQLKVFAREFLHEEVGLKLFLILLKEEKSVAMATELLSLYPSLHQRNGLAGRILIPILDPTQSKSAELLRSCLSQPAPFSLIQWGAALLCCERKECIRQGEAIVEGLSLEQQRELWKIVSDQLLKSNADALFRIMALFNSLSIIPQSHQAFFIQWIDTVKKTKNEKKLNEFQKYMEQHHKEILDLPELKQYRGKVVGWIDSLRKVIQRLDKQPERSAIELMKERQALILKKCADLKDDEQFADYFLSNNLPHFVRQDDEKILHNRLIGIKIDPRKKLALFVRYQFSGKDSWSHLLDQLDEMKLWGDSVVKDAVKETLSKQNGYGRFLWMLSEKHFIHLLLKSASQGFPIPMEDLNLVLEKVFPVQEGEYLLHPNAVFNVLCIRLQLRVRESQFHGLTLDDRRQQVNHFIAQCQNWDYHTLVDHQNDLFYHYWQANRYLWDECGERFLQALSVHDLGADKRKLVAVMIGYTMLVDVEVDFTASLDALDRLKGLPQLSLILSNVFDVLVEVDHDRVVGDLSKISTKMAPLFIYFQYDRFDPLMEGSQLSRQYWRNVCKFFILINLLSKPLGPTGSIGWIILETIPAKVWIDLLKQFLINCHLNKSYGRFYLNGMQENPLNSKSDMVLFCQLALIIFSRFLNRLQIDQIKELWDVYHDSALAASLAIDHSLDAVQWRKVLRSLDQFLKGQKFKSAAMIMTQEEMEKCIRGYKNLSSEPQREEARAAIVHFLNSWLMIGNFPSPAQEELYVNFGHVMQMIREELEYSDRCAALFEKFYEIIPFVLEKAFHLLSVKRSRYGFTLFHLIRSIAEGTMWERLYYLKLIDMALKEEDFPYLELMNSELKKANIEFDGLKPMLQMSLEKSDPLKITGDKESWNGLFEAQIVEVEEAFHSGNYKLQQALADQLEERLNQLCEQKQSEMDLLKQILRRYFESAAVQEMRRHRKDPEGDMRVRSFILLSLVEWMDLNTDASRLSFAKDIKNIFSNILLKKLHCTLFSSYQLDRLFEIFVYRTSLTFKNPSLPKQLFEELLRQFPSEPCFGKPLNQRYLLALIVGLPCQHFNPKLLFITLRLFLSSQRATEVHLGFYLLAGLMRKLSKFELNQLMEGVLCHPNTPQQITVERWMLSEGVNDWLEVSIGLFNEFQHPQVRKQVLDVFKIFVEFYDQIQNQPLLNQLHLYLTWINTVSCVKKMGSSPFLSILDTLSYPSIIKEILEKILTQFFPIRRQLEKTGLLRFSSFAKAVMLFSQVMITSMVYTRVTSVKEREQTMIESRQVRRDFYRRLCDLAQEENDPSFVKEALEGWELVKMNYADCDLDAAVFDEVKQQFSECLKFWNTKKKDDVFKQIQNAKFEDEEEQIAFAQKATDQFKDLFSGHAHSSPSMDINLAFIHYVQFMTQRFQNKKASAAILKELVDAHPNPSLLKLPPKSLNTVNLCIGTPFKEYIRNFEECARVAATLHRYLHSIDPLVVDTGFSWLGSLLRQMGHAEESSWLLSLLFDPEYRKKHVPQIKFEGSNPGPILIEPWMLGEGLSHFLIHIQQKVSGKVQEETRQLLKSCFSLFDQIGKLPKSKQISTYFAFFSFIIFYRKSMMSAFNGVIQDYRFMANRASDFIFSLFLPNQREIVEKKYLGSGDVYAMIIAMGTEMIACISAGSSSGMMFMTELPMLSLIEQIQFQEKLLQYAQRHKNVSFLESYLKTIRRIQIENCTGINQNIPFADFITKGEQVLAQLKPGQNNKANETC